MKPSSAKRLSVLIPPSVVFTGDVYVQLAKILDMKKSEQAFHLSRLMDDLAREFEQDTGELIGKVYDWTSV